LFVGHRKKKYVNNSKYICNSQSVVRAYHAIKEERISLNMERWAQPKCCLVQIYCKKMNCCLNKPKVLLAFCADLFRDIFISWIYKCLFFTRQVLSLQINDGCLPRAISHGLQFNGSLSAEKCRLIAAACKYATRACTECIALGYPFISR